jgi:REP element-mobilizing transposase RayT
MTSHLHLIISAKESNKLSEIIRDFKKHTAKTIIKEIEKGVESRREWLLWYFIREGKKDKRITKYKFWKEDNHAIYLHPSEIKIIDQKINYIHQNPVLEGIVDIEEEYVYSSARDYADKKGLVFIDFL